MYRIIHIIIILAIGVSGGIFGEEVPIIVEEPLELFTYPDDQTILVHWKIPPSIRVESIVISRSEDIFSEPSVIYEYMEEIDRYLDTQVTPGQRYFYFVDIKSVDGLMLSSSREHPTFNRLKSTIQGDTEMGDFPSFQSLEELWNHISRIELVQTNYTSIPAIESILNIDSLSITDLSTFGSMNAFFVLDGYLLSTQKDSLIASIHETLGDVQNLYRNTLLVIPDEWEAFFQTELKAFEEKLDMILKLIGEYQDHIANVPPVRISTIMHGRTDSAMVELDIVTFKDNHLSLRFREERFEVLFPDTLPSSNSLSIPIPNTWTSCEIIYNDQILDQQLIPFESSVSIDPFNNVIPKDITAPSGRRHIINEWLYNAKEGNLTIESFIPAGYHDEFLITLNGVDIWKIYSGTTMDDQYVDSAFVLETVDTTRLLWLNTMKRTDAQELMWVETILMNPVESIHKARQPDGLTILDANRSTFGKSNSTEDFEIQTIAVPEVFALYQNYPNPFNNSTTISFDLLQDAMITLHVSDAKGRVVETFIEQSPLNSGRYSYHWEGGHHASGVYFFTVYAEVENYLPISFTRKMIYLK